MPIRIQRKRTKGWRKPPNSVIVDRTSKYGNPYVIGRDGTREECIAKYENDTIPYQSNDDGMDKLLITRENVRRIKEDLGGKDLICSCSLDLPCHADFLLKIANS